VPDTTIELHTPTVDGRDVDFHWTVDPPSDIYRSNSFRLRFPESIDISAIPERLWWTVFLLCVHSHWTVMRPCTVRLPVELPVEEIDFWQRLLETYVATAEAQRGGDRYERDIDIVSSGRRMEPIAPPPERGIFAAAFSGGKDSLVQAEILYELGHDPILVATTSLLPGLVDHSTRHRRRTFDEIQKRRGARLVEVESDLRSAWDNGGASRQGYPFGINEIGDTFLYTAVLVAVGYAMGATHLYLASENEVSENHIESGRFMQHPHFMYSATTQGAIRALLEPTGMYFGSLISSLHSSQVQELLTTRYRDVRDLQFSCWRTTEERRACSECSECKRLGWIAMSLGESPSDLGIDLVHMLTNYDDPERASKVHTYPPSAAVSARMRAQMTRAIAGVSFGRVFWHVIREHPKALLQRRGWRAMGRFNRLRKEARERGHAEAPGYRAGFLETLDPAIRAEVGAIFDEHFGREPEASYIEQLDRQRKVIEHITAPLRRRS